VAETARDDLNGLDILLIVAVVGDELRAAVGAVNFERTLGTGRRLLVADESQVKLRASPFGSICRERSPARSWSWHSQGFRGRAGSHPSVRRSFRLRRGISPRWRHLFRQARVSREHEERRDRLPLLSEQF
jgi:hypothetical protein